MGTARFCRQAGMAGVALLALSGCVMQCGPGVRGMPPPPPPPGAHGHEPPPRDPAREAAFRDCAQVQGLTLPAPGERPRAEGAPRPDRARMDACLQAKGIAPPPPGGFGPPPRHPDPAFDTAFRACAAEQGVQLPERRPEQAPPAPGTRPPARPERPQLDHARLDTCLSGKGFERPAGPPPPAGVPARAPAAAPAPTPAATPSAG